MPLTCELPLSHPVPSVLKICKAVECFYQKGPWGSLAQHGLEQLHQDLLDDFVPQRRFLGLTSRLSSSISPARTWKLSFESSRENDAHLGMEPQTLFPQPGWGTPGSQEVSCPDKVVTEGAAQGCCLVPPSPCRSTAMARADPALDRLGHQSGGPQRTLTLTQGPGEAEKE